MPSNINAQYPIYRKPLTATVRENFAIARDEITELQARPLGIGEVPGSPGGEKWVRMSNVWVPLMVDGGTF
jgi:hypothetical protein